MALAWNICAPLGTLSSFFFNPVFQLSTAKNEINLFNNHILIVAPVTFAPAGAMTPSADFLFNKGDNFSHFLLAFLCILHSLKGSKFFPFKDDSFFRRETKTMWTELFPFCYS